MCYIGSIKPFSPCDEKLGGQQFFRRQHPRVDSTDFGGVGPCNPGVVNRNDSVAHPSDQIDKVIIPVHFGEPNGIAYFAPKTAFLKAG